MVVDLLSPRIKADGAVARGPMQPNGDPTANTTIFKPGTGNYMFELNANEWYL